MENNTSESDQDGGITSGEDTSFERSNSQTTSGRASASGRPESAGGDANGAASAQQQQQAQNSQAQQMQQQQQQQQLQQQQYRAASGMDSQTAMMMSANYLPFMMSTSYPGMMMPGAAATTSSANSQAAAAASFFNRLNQNSLAKDGADGGASAAAGSPLNLQTQQQQQQQRAMPSASPGAQQSRNSPHPTQGSSAYPLPAHQGGGASGAASAYGNQMAAPGRFPGDTGAGAYSGAKPADAKPTEYPPPPKRPLTPYMRFNKFMWEKVKSGNPSMGVCEISAAIGRLWRELGPEEKQRHNDEYTMDKARYDEELKAYLKLTGLRSSDLVKQKAKKTTKPAPAPAAPPPQPAQQQQQQVRRPAAAPAPQQQASRPTHEQQQQQHAQVAAANHHHQQQQQQLQALMGLNMGGSLPIGMPVGFQNMGMLSGFPQMWAAAGQQYPGGLVAAGQLQELYGMNGVEAPPPAHNQQPSGGGDVQASALYRYPQSFM